jgi:acetyl esterase/lipase
MDNYKNIHPQLRNIAKRTPVFNLNRFTLKIIRIISKLIPTVGIPKNLSVYYQKINQTNEDKAPRIRIYQPKTIESAVPCLLWIHGGGMVMGYPKLNDAVMIEFVNQLGIVIVSVDYRLAPENPFPVPLEDCYRSLKWVYEHAAQLSVDTNRISVGGDSAGGGLAATLAQLALDRGEFGIKFQFLVYPMLDDCTAVLDKHVDKFYFGWNQKNNYFGWKAYLNTEPGGKDIPTYAVASRRENLRGLPPAWICCGDLDMFYEEDKIYAQRLNNDGVKCSFESIQGAFHGFDSIPTNNEFVRQFRRRQIQVLRENMF